MQTTDCQEQLSLAVLHATCAKAGFGFQISERIQDNWGWDATAHVKELLEPEVYLFDFRIRFQVKATRQQLYFSQNRYSFSLSISHYNMFRLKSGQDSPIYLVVFQMPHDENEWFSSDPERLILRNCLRWISLRGAPEITDPEQETVTVYLPQNQVLTPESLRKIALKRAYGNWINYDREGIIHEDFV